jgi:hypothetical protein
MVLDRDEEAEAEEWTEGLIGDALDVNDCSEWKTLALSDDLRTRT